MSETVKIGKKAQIVIPKAIRQKMKISEGDSLFIDIVDNAIVMKPVPKTITELAGIAKGLYKENYIDKERDTWQ